ncbi:MAG: hypothetical protein IT550_04840 [Novosphingobium sp.]|nr:hypothetical protein [Novosphingobium sp.]
MGAVRELPRIATIATMPSRVQSFAKVMADIHAQVDHTFVYLDGHAAPPAFLDAMDRVTVLHGEALGNLHSSSRFLLLRDLPGPAVVCSIDDDIAYPPDYTDRLVDVLDKLDGRAIIGVHGRVLMPPHGSYARDVSTIHFGMKLDSHCHVHELGCGTCAFVSDRLPLDPRRFPAINMDDIIVAIEAQKRGLPRIAIAREARWLMPYTEWQEDSLWLQALRDDSEQTRHMHELLALYGSTPPRPTARPPAPEPRLAASGPRIGVSGR